MILVLITLATVVKQNHFENIFFTISLFKDVITEFTVIFLYIYLIYLFISFLSLLAKMNINTCIKTEPTTMADYEFEVNI